MSPTICLPSAAPPFSMSPRIEATAFEPLAVSMPCRLATTLSLGGWPSATATLRLSSSVSRTISAPSSLSMMSPIVPRIEAHMPAIVASMIHLSQRSWLMLVLSPPSMPAFLQAASSATSDARAGLPSRSPNDTPEAPLCRISPLGPSMPEMRARPPATCSAPNLPSRAAKWAWPFSIGTMTVSGPTAGAIESIAESRS